MAFADDAALEAEHMAQADAEPVCQHDQARGNFLAIRQHDTLAFVAGGNLGHLGVNGSLRSVGFARAWC